MYTTFNNVTTFHNAEDSDFLDLALGQLTELYDKAEIIDGLYQRMDFAYNDIKARLNDFVKENHHVTEGPALIEELVAQFDLEASRRLSATVDVRYTISVDAPYTVSVDDFEGALGELDYGINLRYGMNNECDIIDAYVEEVVVSDIDED